MNIIKFLKRSLGIVDIPKQDVENIRNEIIGYLNELIAGNISIPNSGVCANIEAISKGRIDGISFVRTYCRSWAHFSGDDVYPVLGYGQYKCDKTMWEDEQGELRRDLCRHLIERVKSDKRFESKLKRITRILPKNNVD